MRSRSQEWATIQRTGEFAYKRWFEQQIRGRSCTIVLIGAETATRGAIQHEITRSWQLGLGVLGVHIHALQEERATRRAQA